MSTNFDFKEQREQSAIKTNIVLEYFDAWSKIFAKRREQISYVELYAGPGQYEEGTDSTPLLVLKKIISSEELKKTVVVFLNEKDNNYYCQLQHNVESLDGISSLKYKPVITNKEITYDSWKNLNLPSVPSFCFIDPSGYYGLSQKLLYSLGAQYGTDILFFFNFNEINRGVSNSKVFYNMKELFGERRFYELEQMIDGKSGTARELIVVNEMKRTLQDIGFTHILPFSFKAEGKNRTSHYLFFATKNDNAFKIMKEIMWKYGEKDMYGIGQYGFIPTVDKQDGIQLSLVDLFDDPYEKFETYLCTRYAGESFTVEKLFNADTNDTPFTEKQYKNALKQLEINGKITCVPSYENRPKNTMANKVKITFPNL